MRKKKYYCILKSEICPPRSLKIINSRHFYLDNHRTHRDSTVGNVCPIENVNTKARSRNHQDYFQMEADVYLVFSTEEACSTA